MFSGNNDDSLIGELKLDPFDCLDKSSGRNICKKCNRSRKYFCYNCLEITIPEKEEIPKVTLPIDLIL